MTVKVRTQPAPPAGIRWTPTFSANPRKYKRGTFSMTEAERAQHEANMAARKR